MMKNLTNLFKKEDEVDDEDEIDMLRSIRSLNENNSDAVIDSLKE
jgi:hypothetical protein